MDNPKPKTEPQRRRDQFVLAYAVTGNATAAAVSAGYSVKCAQQQGSEFLRDPVIGTRAREARETHLANQAAAYERHTQAIFACVEGSIQELYRLALTAKSEMARVQALDSLLDRAGFQAVQKVEAKNEHTFQNTQQIADEVDSRLDSILAGRTVGAGSSGDRPPTH